MKIGDFVRYPVPASKRKEQFAYARVCAVDTCTDDNGTLEWIYVRWIDCVGKPGDEPTKHAADELELME